MIQDLRKQNTPSVANYIRLTSLISVPPISLLHQDHPSHGVDWSLVNTPGRTAGGIFKNFKSETLNTPS